jgi:hypothetical protein
MLLEYVETHLQYLQPAARVQFGEGASAKLQRKCLSTIAFEDEDDDEDENEAHCECVAVGG